jgi:hypothetical protein
MYLIDSMKSILTSEGKSMENHPQSGRMNEVIVPMHKFGKGGL